MSAQEPANQIICMLSDLMLQFTINSSLRGIERSFNKRFSLILGFIFEKNSPLARNTMPRRSPEVIKRYSIGEFFRAVDPKNQLKGRIMALFRRNTLSLLCFCRKTLPHGFYIEEMWWKTTKGGV